MRTWTQFAESRKPIVFALVLAAGPLYAQYDKVAALASDSSLTPIGGPASSPSIFIGPYDLPDLRPTGKLNDHLPKWLQFGLDERLRFEGYSSSGFKPNVSDSYLLNRLRVGMLLQPTPWFKVVAQVQDARSFLQTPPLGPPKRCSIPPDVVILPSVVPEQSCDRP